MTERRLLLLILLAGIVVRTYGLGRIPPGLNQDEASAGYEAFALLHYGVDRNGSHNPVHLVSWGSGQNALYSYLAMPAIALLGLNVLAVRSVSWAFSILTFGVFYAFVRRIAGPPTALLALFLLAISPWHVMLSRWALESNLLPGVFLIGAWLLLRALDAPALLPLSFSCFALALYAYGSAYLVVPVFLAACSVHLLRRGALPPRALLAAWVAFLVVALPIGLFVAINALGMPPIRTPLLSIPRLALPPRFTLVTSLFGERDGLGLAQNLGRFLRLMATQDDPRIFNQIPGFGYAYWFGPPLAVVGLAVAIGRCVRGTAAPGLVVLVLWLGSSVLLGFVYVAPNVNRVNLVFLPMIALAAVGIEWLASRLGTGWTRARPAVLSAAVLLGLVSFTRFAAAYFGTFPERSGAIFFDGLGEAIGFAVESTPGPVCVTGSVNAPYIFVLFYTRADPRVFQRTVRYAGAAWGVQQVASFDRYSFGLGNCRVQEGSAIVLDRRELPATIGARHVVREFKRYAVVLVQPAVGPSPAPPR